ncbi:prolactin-inducible protein homolog [Ornithorhynchus anatinus]|uniref:prolactin-inducible protein homolog n=1 Tax=Ornithorhynchus anatinus TaxID=9258 RepID=UPI0010A8C948|nr:prolactin-inducible protein homolog [Ornithorhynchus anatinus]
MWQLRIPGTPLWGAALLLALCLQLTTQGLIQGRKPLSVEMIVPDTVRQGQMVSVKVRVTADLKECMAVRVELRNYTMVDFPYGNFKYTACLCGDVRTYFWDVITFRRMELVALAEAVLEADICKEYLAVVPVINHYDIKSKTVGVLA